MQVKSDRSIKYGGEYFPPGTVIEMEAAHAKAAIEGGKVTEVTAADVEEVAELTVAELEDRAVELGIAVEEIKGTGRGGRVLKADLVAAIEAAEAGGAPDTGTKGGAPANPSVAE